MFKNLKFMLFLKFFDCKNMINYNKLLKIYIIVLYTLELILKIGENMDIETVLIIIVVVVGVGLGIFVGGKFGKKVGNKMKDKIEDKWRK